MRKLFLCGRSEAGKTSLTQALKGEELHYHKTQYVNSWDITIDTPGEYVESKGIACALGCFSFDSNVIGLLCSADEPFDLFGYATRPVIGIITKIDLVRKEMTRRSRNKFQRPSRKKLVWKNRSPSVSENMVVEKKFVMLYKQIIRLK